MRSNHNYRCLRLFSGIFFLGILFIGGGCSQEKAKLKESAYLTERGNSAIAEGEWNDAIEFFSAAITNNPSNAEAYYGRSSVRMATGKEFYLLARAAAKEGEYDRVREIAQKADRDFGLAAEDAASVLKISPNDENAYYILGCIAIYQGDWNSALDAFSGAIERNPNMASAYQRRGEVYGYINDSENEITDLKHAAELGYDPKEKDSTEQNEPDDLSAKIAKTGEDEENFRF